MPNQARFNRRRGLDEAPRIPPPWHPFMSSQRFVVYQSRHDIQVKYWPEFEKVLTAKRAAKFFQVDRRLTLMVDLQLASGIPLMQ